MVEEENMVEDSQDILVPFSLHLTQSQTDMDSQAPPAMEVIEEVIVIIIIVLSQFKLFLSPFYPCSEVTGLRTVNCK